MPLLAHASPLAKRREPVIFTLRAGQNPRCPGAQVALSPRGVIFAMNMHRHPTSPAALLTLGLGIAVGSFHASANATGTWQAIAANAPAPNAGVMLLLTDGTILCKTSAGPTYGNVWNKLTPDIHGSYALGTWSTVAAMNDTRYYFSSQVLRDGRVYVGGGEYGTGKSTAEVYNPLTNAWTMTTAPGASLSDANSELLANGKVLQALVAGDLRGCKIFDPSTNTYSNTISCVGIHNESAWVKLSDGSVLMVDRHSTASERYHQALNSWIVDATVPVALYDDYGFETGGAVLLPDGRAFFIGATGHTAFYTLPVSGTTGTWVAGPDVPNAQGTPDAPIAMMVNGKSLCAVSPIPVPGNVFQTPTSFYEFDAVTNAFTRINAPTGGLTTNDVSYAFTFLQLPNGQVMCSRADSQQYYLYTPDGSPLAAGKPAVVGVTNNGAGTFMLSGTLFNGISQGSSYGDDWQMNTNYPVVRLVSVANGNTYYARTFNWTSTGVQTGGLVTTVQMTLPAAAPAGSYQLFVTANGIASNARAFWKPSVNCPSDLNLDGRVDGADLALLLAAWGLQGGTNGSGDLNGDGIVDGADLGLLLSDWGLCTP